MDLPRLGRKHSDPSDARTKVPRAPSHTCYLLICLISFSPILYLFTAKYAMSHTHDLTHPFSFHASNRPLYKLQRSVISKTTIEYVYVQYDADTRRTTALAWEDVLNLWKVDDDFMNLFQRTIQELPFENFYLEMSPLSKRVKRTNTFKFAAIDAPHLAHVTVDTTAFAPMINAPVINAVSGAGTTGTTVDENMIAVFPNLSKTSVLVAPALIDEVTDRHAYSQISYFVRSADPAIKTQQRELWKSLGREIEYEIERDSERPLWVSTDGENVSYLHVRLDRTPKYFKSENLKRWPV
jgi:hypothetical protein